MGKGRIIW